MTRPTKKPARPLLRNKHLEVRLNAVRMNLIECAAALKHQTVAEFAAGSVLEAARRAVAGHQHVALSRRDSKAFVQALTDRPPVNDRLRDTVRRYREATGI